MSLDILGKMGIHGMKDMSPPVLAALAFKGTLLMIGPHGCAKTLLAQRASEYMNCSFRHYNTSLLNYDDLAGYPLPDADTGSLKYIQTPGTIWGAEFVLFDEISRARPEMQNKVFPIVHEHKLQGIPLEELKYCWAAMNPPSDGEDMDDLRYSGSWSLDMALSDRFRFILDMPGFSEIAEEYRRKILVRGSRAEDETINLQSLIGKTRGKLENIGNREKIWVVKYLGSMIPNLNSSGLEISGRRARMLCENIFMIRAAEQVLGEAGKIDDASLRAILFSLPHPASGIKVEKARLMLAHKNASEEASLKKNSPLMVVRRINDPVKRVSKALELGIGKERFSRILSDSLAELDIIRRYAWVYHVFPELSRCGRMNASTSEFLSFIQGNIIKGAESKCTESIPNGSRRWRAWEKISEAIAKAGKGGNVKPEHIAIARAIFFFEEENIDMDEVIEGAEDIRRRLRA